ncbi:MAG: glycosyltransferase family 2 protein, partial [Bryobacteraceae bacterium]|nr:glycosyltransferase family 2 protein [Bryobacteraceae bacterium]
MGPHSERGWEVPAYRIEEFGPKTSKYCVAIPVINEGDRIRTQLARMSALPLHLDVVIGDGGSSDGSLAADYLKSHKVRALLTKTGPGKLSAQLRMLFAWALSQGYAGIIAIDGNNKDGVEAISDFAAKLDEGYDFIQGSRYIPGGHEENTPMDRKLGVMFLHAPMLSIGSGFRYTDTTNGFRAFSARYLLDPRVQPFRDIFSTYNLHFYLSVRAPRLGFRVVEIPVSRVYPNAGPTPSKIGGFRSKWEIILQLMRAALG